jgi:hypothetical protein
MAAYRPGTRWAPQLGQVGGTFLIPAHSITLPSSDIWGHLITLETHVNEQSLNWMLSAADDYRHAISI